MPGHYPGDIIFHSGTLSLFEREITGAMHSCKWFVFEIRDAPASDPSTNR